MKASEAQRLYEELNRRYFRGRLPHYRVRFVRRLFPDSAGTFYGRCDSDRKLILLRHDRAPGAPTLRQSLLHEMCHIGAPGHGKRWQAKMRRLAALGETWAEQEAARYAEEIRHRRPFAAQIKDFLEQLAYTEIAYRWPTVLRLTALEVGKKPRDLLHVAPWVRNVWTRLMKERRDFQVAQEEVRRKIEEERSQRT